MQIIYRLSYEDYTPFISRELWSLPEAAFLLAGFFINCSTLSLSDIEEHISKLQWLRRFIPCKPFDIMLQLISVIRESIDSGDLLLHPEGSDSPRCIFRETGAGTVKVATFIKWAEAKGYPLPTPLFSSPFWKSPGLHEKEDYLYGAAEIHDALFEVYRNHDSWPAAKKFLKRHNISIEYDPSKRPMVKKSDLISFDERFKGHFNK